MEAGELVGGNVDLKMNGQGKHSGPHVVHQLDILDEVDCRDSE